jgi:hypothetical protein
MQPTKRHTLQTLFGLSMAAALLATAAARPLRHRPSRTGRST